MAINVIRHPLVKHKLGLLRDKNTSTSQFRQVANELGAILCYEATRNLPLVNKEINSWAGKAQVEIIKGKKLTVVPILRAGLGLMEGVLTMIPSARVSVLGIFRNETTLEPVEYYEKFAQDMEHRWAVILDPMLATGGSMLAAIKTLKKHHCQYICSLHLVCAPEGIVKIENEFPEVDIYTAAIDEKLDENGYILPGLGDAGDRIFGTR